VVLLRVPFLKFDDHGVDFFAASGFSAACFSFKLFKRFFKYILISRLFGDDILETPHPNCDTSADTALLLEEIKIHSSHQPMPFQNREPQLPQS
jgi:hypothetical protein